MKLLKQDTNSYINKLFDFAGISKASDITITPSNTGWGGFTLKNSRIFNRFTWRNPLGPKQPWITHKSIWVCSLLDKKIPKILNRRSYEKLRKIIEGRIGARYTESNARLAELLKIDLKNLGYLVEYRK